MLSSPFAAVNPNVFGGFDAEIVQVRSLISCRHRTSIGFASNRHYYFGCALPPRVHPSLQSSFPGHVIVIVSDYTWWAESQNACCHH
jgi:hypothetical protein